MDNLKEELYELVQKKEYEVSDILKLINPIDEFVNSELFMNNITKIVEILIKDRNGDNRFDLRDLEALSKDYISIADLIANIIMVISLIPTINLKYDSEATEELVLKIMVYIFLIIIPEKTELEWTVEDKQKLIDISFIIYSTFKTSQYIKDIVKEAVNWVKKQDWKAILTCKCCRGSSQEQIQNDKILVLNEKLKISVQNVKGNEELKKRIEFLESKFQ